MPVDILLGLQWGDEGKGKIVDVLGERYGIIARFQGGPNAGHTLVINDRKYVLHQIPSGVFHPKADCIIGNGVVLNPVVLRQEFETLKNAGLDITGRLFVSNKAHLILPTHRLLDQFYEANKGAKKIGSTLRGIGPTYQDKVARLGLRVGDVLSPHFQSKLDDLYSWHESLAKTHHPDVDFDHLKKEFLDAVEFLKTLTICQTELKIAEALRNNVPILAEGAQGTLLDVDFGSYPFVTSSSAIAGGACIGLGVPPTAFRRVYGVIKAYCTRVGSGPFPTELHNEEGEWIRKSGNEFGSTTGRPRRCGWLDLPTLRYAIMLNGVTDLVLTKADVLCGFETLKVCTHYKANGEFLDYPPFDLETELEPVYREFAGWKQLKNNAGLDEAFQTYIQFLENELGVSVSIISTGADRRDVVLNKLD